MPLVSVILTTKNEAANIERCLASVAAQTLRDIELIVVDNGSTDRTKELARRYTAKVFDHGPERSAQRNFGVKQASGELILYLDADMALSPGVVAECAAAFSRDPGLVGLYIPERIVGQGFWIKVRDFERSFYDGTVIDAVRCVRRRLFLELGGFDETLHGPEDWDFDKRVRQRGRVATISASLAHDEGDFDLRRYLGKKSYYAQSFDSYVAKWGQNDPDLRRQLGAIYRFFGVFCEHRQFLRLLRHPRLAAGMYYLRLRVGIAFLNRRVASDVRRRWLP
jgi:glycosyltransferase involved in cell wall biosynthesis